MHIALYRMHWGPIELSSSLLLFGVSFLLKNSNAPAILLLLGRLDMCYVMYAVRGRQIVDYCT